MLIRHYIDGASFPVGGSTRLAQTAADVIRRANGAVLVAAEVASVALDDDGRPTPVPPLEVGSEAERRRQREAEVRRRHRLTERDEILHHRES